MSDPTVACDSQCPNITRSHRTAAAMRRCKDERRSGRALPRAAALIRKPARPSLTMTTAGVVMTDRRITEDISTAAMWRPDFRGSSFEMSESEIEGAYLPGADLRRTRARECFDGVPVFALAEARGAILDDEWVDEALQGPSSWLLCAPEATPKTDGGRFAVDYLVPMLQWAFTDTQWERLLSEGHDPDELVLAAQTFPPRNEAAFRALLDTGDPDRALRDHPHRQAWGSRGLADPPRSHARTAQMMSSRS